MNQNDLINIPAYIEEICSKIRNKGFKCYVVGGAIRDQLLNNKVIPEEWDIATSATPDDIKQIFEKCIPTGIAHGTVSVIVENHRVEITTFRKEGKYIDARHPENVTFVSSIEEDLGRRDFTINAIAYEPALKILVDPYHGISDLEKKLVRAVGNPEARFKEDGLRPLRAARFAAVLGFRIEENTFEAMKKAKNSFLMVSAERKRDEIIKMTKAEKPSIGWEVLRRSGYIETIFPEMKKMFGAFGGQLHKFDVWNHSIMTCDFCRGSWQVKIAALMHDIGKPFVEINKESGEENGENKVKCLAPTEEEEKESSEKKVKKTFVNHEKFGAEIVERWMERMRFSREDITLVKRLILNHMICYSPQWSDGAIRRFIGRVGEDIIEDLFNLVEADIKARGHQAEAISLLNELKTRVYNELNQKPPLTVKDLAVSGYDIMRELNLDPGPVIGKILQLLLEEVIEEPSKNKRETLLKRLHEIRGSIK